MDSVRFTYAMTIISVAALGYFTINQNNIVGSKAPKRDFGQVAFRDPKLIADHQKLLDAENAKKRTRAAPT